MCTDFMIQNHLPRVGLRGQNLNNLGMNQLNKSQCSMSPIHSNFIVHNDKLPDVSN